MGEVTLRSSGTGPASISLMSPSYSRCYAMAAMKGWWAAMRPRAMPRAQCQGLPGQLEELVTPN